MNNKAFEITENVLIVCGVGIGLAQIEQILGIVLLAVQVILIFVRVGMSVYKKIKEGKIQDAIEEAQKGQKEIQALTEKGKKDGKQ